jgi:hypothetical protein
LKAERAWFLDRRERRAKPETESLLTRWGKSDVFSSYSAEAVQTVFSTPSLILFISRIYGCLLAAIRERFMPGLMDGKTGKTAF